ncbi:MAG: response regulator [Calditrichaceae bacterium]
MKKIHVLAGPNKEIDNLLINLKEFSFDCSQVTSLFELKKKCAQSKPDAVIVADNLKEKVLKHLVPAVLALQELIGSPVMGITTEKDHMQSTEDFFKQGASDVLHLPADAYETSLRINLRIHEAGLRNTLTTIDFFFSEAQEKEQGRRSGIFHFYNANRIRVGEVVIASGKVVGATYGSIIKEDAFLQLACSSSLSFRFEDRDDIGKGKFIANITNLLLDASKLKDEIKKQESCRDEQLKALIVDPNRIARLMTNRFLKNMGIDSKVTSPEEFTIRFLAKSAPDFLILDYGSSEKILDMIWPDERTNSDIPVIIYCDDVIKNLNFNFIGKHEINGCVYKKRLHVEIKELLDKLFNLSAENK